MGYRLVWLAEQRLQAEQHALYIVHGAPLVAQDIQADAAGEVDIGVVDRRLEENGRRRVGIVVGECKGQLEYQALVRGLGRTGDGRGPGQEVAIGVREGRDAGGGRQHELHQLRLQTVKPSRQ